MKRMVLILLLGAWAVVSAQTTPGEDPAAEPAAETGVTENAAPCVPAAEVEPPGDDPPDGEPPAEPCVEPSPETFPEEEPFLGEDPDGMEDDLEGIEEEFGSAIDENALPTEASPEEEFTPGDEISEDYPVPLPSDI